MFFLAARRTCRPLASTRSTSRFLSRSAQVSPQSWMDGLLGATLQNPPASQTIGLQAAEPPIKSGRSTRLASPPIPVLDVRPASPPTSSFCKSVVRLYATRITGTALLNEGRTSRSGFSLTISPRQRTHRIAAGHWQVQVRPLFALLQPCLLATREMGLNGTDLEKRRLIPNRVSRPTSKLSVKTQREKPARRPIAE